MLDYEVQRFTRHCHASGRELASGEAFYSVLIAEGRDVVRQDYAASTWQGPPEGALAVWKSQVPHPHSKKMQLAPSEVMLRYFEELEGRPDKEDERYVLALLMLRRRVVRQERTEHDGAGREVAVLYAPQTEQEYRVAVAMPSAERVAAIQEELGRLLFSSSTA
jgi:hypothetical protein